MNTPLPLLSSLCTSLNSFWLPRIKGIGFLVLALFPYFVFSQTEVMSFNIRYATEADGLNRWELRKEEVVSFIRSEQPDLLGVQEALSKQLDYLKEKLNAYDHIGHGRDGENTNSEAVPLFYKKDKYTLLDSEVFWLSPTPETPSKGWDAALPRIAVYGVFEDVHSRDTLYVINTHFDHMGSEARLQSSGQLLKWIEKNTPEEAMIVLMGDLNCEPDSEPIRHLSSSLVDTYTVNDNDTETGTFNGFDPYRTQLPRIDYIFSKGWEVISSGVFQSKRSDGGFLSDHFAVWAELAPENDRN